MRFQMVLLVFLLFCVCFPQVLSVEFTIGALLSNENILSKFERMVTAVSDEVGDEIIKFQATGEILSINALKATDQVCSLFNLTSGRIFALIISHPSGASGAPPLSVSFTSSFYYLPTIGVSARQAVFSDKYSHASFLRTVPPFSREAEIWADLIIAFQWREVCVIHSDDQDAKFLMSRLERASWRFSTAKAYFKITRQIVVNTDEEDAARMRDFVTLLMPIKKEQTRVVLVFLRRSFAEYVFAAARKLGMLEAEWAWIVTEQALQASNIPQGVIGVRLREANELDHVADAVRVATTGIMAMARQHPDAMQALHSARTCSEDPLEIRSRPRKDGQVYIWNEYAVKLYQQMLKVRFEDGRTGRVEFDENGDRVRPIYEIVNAQMAGERTSSGTHLPGPSVFKRPDLVTVGSYGIPQVPPSDWLSDIPYPLMLSVNMSMLVWPGNSIVERYQLVCVKRDKEDHCHSTEKRLVPAAPISFKKKTHLTVVTSKSIPFVYTRPKRQDERCNESDDPLMPRMEVECTHTDPVTGVTTYHCCYGYCIDLLRHLANRTGVEVNPTLFTYDLHLVGDGQVGEEIVENDTRKWTGIVGELLSGMADLAVAPMSITPERASRVEFSKPFKYLGITILIKREQAKSNLGSFLQPFENTLWVLVALSVHVVAWALYLMDRFSPYGPAKLRRWAKQQGLAKPEYWFAREEVEKGQSPKPQTTLTTSDGDDEGLTLSSAVYFAWGILLNSGIGEGTPRAFSTRVFGMVWAGFAMIITASYTANLAAFLVLDRPESYLSGIDDMRQLRNPQKDFTFATVRGSPVEMHFKRQIEYSTMYRTMAAHNYPSVDEAISAVKSGALKAFIWDSARLNYEAAQHCDLITTGEVFGRSGYGLAMKRDNPWLHELSQAVLNFHERGIMEKLDTRWIHVSGESCEKTEASPATLGLSNIAGVFIMIAAGIANGCLILLVEILCRKKKRNALVAHAFHHWRDTVKEKKLTDNAAEQNMLKKDDEKLKRDSQWVSKEEKPVTSADKSHSGRLTGKGETERLRSVHEKA
ncbi:unnamed protein product [Calicophoron daubneyi]|uniref:Glutamate [NMDA] receptor subunit 1 n=1 Tax=Calicophoron daubneyi TaxID=300641 RepID=A0AAV2TS61_CALDB